MPQNGEQSQQKRRRANAGSQDSPPLTYSRVPKSTALTPIESKKYGIDDGFKDPARSHTSSIRYNQSLQPHTEPIPPVATRRKQSPTRGLSTPSTPQDYPKERKRVHWLLPLGLGMMAMLVVWVTGSWALAWGTRIYNDYRYGNPRTYQVDAVVGHGGDSAANPSHFIATNHNRQAIVVEFQAGDPQKAVSYVANIFIAGEGGDLAPVTVEFRDVTGDKKVDMLIHIQLPNQDQVSVFVNEGDKFRPSTEKDAINLNLSR